MATALTVPERTGRVVASDLEVQTLGPCRYPSPLVHRLARSAVHYVGKADRVLLEDRLAHSASSGTGEGEAAAFVLAGPRDRVFFDTAHLRCGIVTCGGLCPGINNVIRADYHIRSVPASPTDSVFCWNLARNAVHAAMAGNTDMLIGRWHGRFVHVPMPLTTRFRKQVDTADELWMSVVESTGQPRSWSE
jgi:hypothetical protein